MTTIISAFTELSTKCWLIAKGRLSDLVEYTQTHNIHFAEEAQLIVTKVTYNSPFDMSVNFPNLDPKNIAEAFKEAIDTVTQAKQRLKQTELETEAKAESLRQAKMKADQEYQAKQQELEIAAQKATHDNQIALLEQEKQKFELERQQWTLQVEQERQKLDLEKKQLVLQMERLTIENMRINYAIEAANKIIDMLAPGIDQAARAMMIPTLLPNLLQFQNGRDLELTLPMPPRSEEETVEPENG